ncbi:MAG: hypothetical protein LBR97_08475 [Dysgonamonadaceae bacterium]|jgi:hypothetical protein|nr:hypothetical protein [Dysgonamonadaceae bacterium]
MRITVEIMSLCPVRDIMSVEQANRPSPRPVRDGMCLHQHFYQHYVLSGRRDMDRCVTGVIEIVMRKVCGLDVHKIT